MRLCPGCNKERGDGVNFTRDGVCRYCYRRKWRSTSTAPSARPDRHNEYVRTSAARRQAMVPEDRYARWLKYRWGITLSVYYDLLDEQGGGCAICLSQPSGTKKWLCIDHCHDTGKIRGLLCDRCNIALGKMRDSPENLRRAAEYVELSISRSG